MVRSAGRSVSAGCCEFSTNIKVRNCGYVLMMCSILMAYLLAMAVIMELIKNKAQREYYMSTLLSLKVPLFLYCIKKYRMENKIKVR